MFFRKCLHLTPGRGFQPAKLLPIHTLPSMVQTQCHHLCQLQDQPDLLMFQHRILLWTRAMTLLPVPQMPVLVISLPCDLYPCDTAVTDFPVMLKVVETAGNKETIKETNTNKDIKVRDKKCSFWWWISATPAKFGHLQGKIFGQVLSNFKSKICMNPVLPFKIRFRNLASLFYMC